MLNSIAELGPAWPILFAAQPGDAQGPPGWAMIPYIVFMFAILYLIMIRPQQKRQKELRQMLDRIGKGDKVVTSGGLHGIVAGVKEDVVVLRIAENVRVEVSKSHIATVRERAARDAAEKSEVS